jgi:hypothetical protein
VLNGLQPSKVEPLIKVTLDVSDDGMLTATARNMATKAEVSHALHSESGMSETEIAALKALGVDEFEEGEAA